jgi:hypothetical protein
MTLENAGTWTIGSGASALLAGNFANTGLIELNAGRLAPNPGYLTTWTNSGVITGNGGTIVLSGTWSNGSGTLNLTNTTLGLGGTFTIGSLGTIIRSGGSANITGFFDNSSTTFAVNPVTGSFRLAGGTVFGGRIDATAGVPFLLSSGTIDALQIAGAFQGDGTNQFFVKNGLTFDNATVALQGGGLFALGTQTLSGNGTIVFNGSAPTGSINTGSELTLGPNMTIQTGSESGAVQGSTLVNHGLVSARTPGKTLFVSRLVNHGTMEAINGATLIISSNGFSNLGTISVNNATLSLGGEFNVASIGTIVNNGGTVNLGAFVHMGSTTFALNPTLGSWNLTNFAHISGGTITATGGTSWTVANGDATLTSATLAHDLHMQPGSRLRLVNGTLFATGARVIDGIGLIDGTPGFLSGTGSWTLGPGITLATGTGTITISAACVNNGTISARNPIRPITVLAPFNNQGVCEVQAGTLSIPSAQIMLANFSGGTLSGGTWAVYGGATISFGPVVSITTNNANIRVDGVGSTFVALNQLRNNLGRLTISGGRKFTSVGSLTNSGTIEIGPGSALKVLGSLNNTGAVDLNGAAIVDYTGSSPLISLTAQIGTSIVSTTTFADPSKRIGVGETSAVGVSTFAGLSVDSTSVVLKLTYGGDADLDGDVDVADLGRLATSWQSAAPWTGGDFDYSGSIDVNDLGLLAINWQAGVGSPLGPSLSELVAAMGLPTVAVPEPSALGLLILSAHRLRCRRRR